MAGKPATGKAQPGLVTKRPKRKVGLDPRCYLKFAIANSYNMRQRLQGRPDREVIVDLRRKKKLVVQNTNAAPKAVQAETQASNQLPNRRVDVLKKELSAVLKTSAAKLSSSQIRKKIAFLELRMKNQSSRPKFEARDRRRIHLRWIYLTGTKNISGVEEIWITDAIL